MSPRTVGDALTAARRSAVARLDARLLLGHVLSRPATWLIAHEEVPLSDEQAGRWRSLLARRIAGEPVAYLLGVKEFCGLDFAVGPDVLVPRPETELLVAWASEILASRPDTYGSARLADLGTGSGAIAVALKHRHPDAHVVAVDVSADALASARCNADRHSTEVEFLEGAWFAPLRHRRFDLIVSNPPYVADDDAHLAALTHEPRLALVGGEDGLDAIREIVRNAPAHLVPGGWLLLEHGFDQGPAVRRLLEDAGFDAVDGRTDLAGLARLTGGRVTNAHNLQASSEVQ